MSGDIERLPRRLRHLIYEVIAKLVAWTNLPRISASPMAEIVLLPLSVQAGTKRSCSA
jgi:hypothetical protein